MSDHCIDWLERARKLAPIIETYRDEAERLRQMPRSLFEVLRDAGFFRLWLPRRLGGPEVDLATMILVVEELARIDGAAGWNVMIGAEGSALAAYLREEPAREMMASPHTVVAGSVQPRGEARTVEGGYRVHGVWPLASGCAYATVVVVVCRVVEEGRVRTQSDGAPDLQVLIVPASEREIIDTWHSAGLRGTGSHDIRVEGAFVPEARSFPLSRERAPERGSLYGATLAVLFALPVSAVGLGIARAALDAFIDLAAGKVRFGGSAPLAQDGLVQATVGRAEARLRSARAFVLDVALEMTRSTATEGQVARATAPLVHLAAAQAAETSAEVVTTLFELAGSSAVYTGHRLERCLRDVHMITQHRATNVFNFETSGRQLLGIER